MWNRGKESLVADLSTDEGRAVTREAALHADVLLAGVPAGKLDQWGLGEADLRDANPRLVICEITGFGPTGAYASLKAYEGVVAARAGKYDEAVRHWKAAKELAPAYPNLDRLIEEAQKRLKNP